MSDESIRAHRVDTGRITLNVREVGQGPVMIFMHGITSNAAVFDPIALALAKDFRCVAVDQRGHGLSDKPETGYGGKDFADDIVALVKTIDAGPAVIVGHSLGSRNAIVMGARSPEVIRSVIAVDFTPFIETEVLDSLESRVNAGDRLFKSRQEIEAYLHERYPRMPADAVRQRAMTAYKEVDGGLRPLASPSAMAQTATGLRENIEAEFKAMTRPTLVVRGIDSKFTSAAALEKSRALRPDLPVLIVEGVDHYVTEEAPEVCIEAFRDFALKHQAV